MQTPILRYSLPLLLACGTTASSPGGEKLDLPTMFREGIPPSPFIGVVYRYADAMLKHGRDGYGPQKTGLLLSALDRKTLSVLKTRPVAPDGLADESRPGPHGGPLVGACPQMDQNVLRLLYFLVGLSGEDRYGKAADEELTWLLRDVAGEGTGRMPWGERYCWDVVTDRVVPAAKTPADRFFGPWMLWPQCFRLAPEQSTRLAVKLLHSVSPPPDVEGVSDPPGVSRAERASRGDFSLRQAGFLIRTFAEAYSHTSDKRFLAAIEVLLTRYDVRLHSTGRPILLSSPWCDGGAMISLAIDCDAAARNVPEPLRTRLTTFAASEDRRFWSSPHELTRRKGFFGRIGLETEDLEMEDLEMEEEEGATNGRGSVNVDFYTTPWKTGHGRHTTAAIAMMCVSRYENTGKVPYRELIVAAADAYLDSLPEQGTDAWPMTFGHAISLELSAFRITAGRKYHDRAFKLGEIAVERFFGEDPLPRASLKTDHYESTTGAGTLLLALAELHLSTLHITAVRAPSNTIDR